MSTAQAGAVADGLRAPDQLPPTLPVAENGHPALSLPQVPTDQALKPRPAPTQLASTPLLVENVGQFAPGARFLLLNGPGRTWLAQDAIWITLWDEPAAEDGLFPEPGAPLPPMRGVHLRLSFDGANPEAILEPVDPQPAQVSYLLGQDAARWHAAVPAWGGARYRELYPGIDLVIGQRGATGSVAALPWRLEARAGADLDQVRLQVEGAEAATTAAGILSLHTTAGDLNLKLPALAGQGAGNSLVRELGAEHFQVEAPFGNSAGSLAPDLLPDDLVYSTYLGGSSWEIAYGIDIDDAEHAYIVGRTPSTDFPTTPGAFSSTVAQVDAFIAKLAADGSQLIYATYLGGVGQETGYAIAVSNGEAYVAGETDSSDFPIAGGTAGETDAFIVKLNTTGTALVYARLIGGRDFDAALGVAVEGTTAYIGGSTLSSNFPGGGYVGNGDAFAVKLNADGSTAYAKILGGSLEDSASAVAVWQGRAYLSGLTLSPDFPGGGYAGGGDAFVVRLDASGNRQYTALLGGLGEDRGFALATDGSGQAYVTGSTASSDFPATFGTYGGGTSDAFVALIDGSGALQSATFLGGTGVDQGRGIGLDQTGIVGVAGFTSSSDFPVTDDAYDPTANGSYDGFAARVDLSDPAMVEVIYATYLGGTDEDRVYGAAMGQEHNAYLTGFTRSGDFPTTDGAFDGSLDGTRDAFAARLILGRDEIQLTYSLAAGWNLISFPLVLVDPDPAVALASIAGFYNLVYGYDGCDTADPWKRYDPAAPPFVNDLTILEEEYGYWLRTTGPVSLTITGTFPVSTAITLCTGWNLIGYPSQAVRPIETALAGIAGSFDLVYAYDANDPADPWKRYDPNAPPFVNDLTHMRPWLGYWIRMTAPGVWVVDGP